MKPKFEVHEWVVDKTGRKHIVLKITPLWDEKTRLVTGYEYDLASKTDSDWMYSVAPESELRLP